MASSDTTHTGTTTGLGATVLAPAGFLVAYLAVSPVSGAFADRDLPLPGSPASEVVAYFAANPVPVGITAVLQVLSVACLSVFVVALTPALRAAGTTWPAAAGHLSAAAIVVSSLLSVTAAATATSVGEPTVEVLRQASFYAGGVVAVVALGAFVVGASLALGRGRLLGRPTRWFGLFAGGIALLSVLSLVFYYASVALPVGRVLGMVWAVVAGVVIHRRLSGGTRVTR